MIAKYPESNNGLLCRACAYQSPLKRGCGVQDRYWYKYLAQGSSRALPIRGFVELSLDNHDEYSGVVRKMLLLVLLSEASCKYYCLGF